MTAPITIHDLQIAYQEATRNQGIIALVHDLRNPNVTLKIRDLNSCFSTSLWSETHQSTGHKKMTHKITKVIIEYQNHGSKDVKGHIQKQILDAAQKHLNILCNDIFKYSINHWAAEPDYNVALSRCNALA